MIQSMNVIAIAYTDYSKSQSCALDARTRQIVCLWLVPRFCVQLGSCSRVHRTLLMSPCMLSQVQEYENGSGVGRSGATPTTTTTYHGNNPYYYYHYDCHQQKNNEACTPSCTPSCTPFMYTFMYNSATTSAHYHCYTDLVVAAAMLLLPQCFKYNLALTLWFAC